MNQTNNGVAPGVVTPNEKAPGACNTEGFDSDIRTADFATKPAPGGAPALVPNQAAANRYLTLLDEESEAFTFQTFDDNKKSEVKDPSLTHILHGTLDQYFALLSELNQRGAGIFVTVNQTDLKGRKLGNMILLISEQI